MRCGNVHEDAADHFDLKCAWCKQVIGESNVKDSHGMCEACYLRELQVQRERRGHPEGPTHSTDVEPARE
jgi:hypothetical protein